MFKQINKIQARKFHEQGKPYIIVAAKMPPSSMFAIRVAPTFRDFNDFYNEFCCYHCNNETGRYPRFYVEE